jgi:hypothetical protein
MFSFLIGFIAGMLIGFGLTTLLAANQQAAQEHQV